MQTLPSLPSHRAHRPGSASWTDSLISEARAHRAVQHPFLHALADGSFGAQTRAAARSFAHAYAGYSQWFPRYLGALIDRIESPSHKELLLDNLREEKGRLESDDRDCLVQLGIDPDDVDGVPHPQLFLRFCHALGLRESDLARPPIPTIEWRTGFLAALRAGSPAFGVGALGLGTESIVATFYELVVQGLDRIQDLSRRDRVFFDLHCHVDDQHQKDLLSIALDLSRDPQAAKDMLHGVRLALTLREQFLDALHATWTQRWQVLPASEVHRA